MLRYVVEFLAGGRLERCDPLLHLAARFRTEHQRPERRYHLQIDKSNGHQYQFFIFF